MELNNKNVSSSATQESVPQSERLRRPYHAPHLTQLGALAVDTTGGGGLITIDGIFLLSV